MNPFHQTTYITMKQIIFLLIIALLGIYGSELWGQSKQITIPLTYPGQNCHVNIDVFSGTVHVKGTSRRDVLVRYELLEGGEEQQFKPAENGLKKITGAGVNLDVREKDNKVKIDSDHSSKAIRVFVEVPYRSDIKVGTHHHGDIEVLNVAGELELEGHHGAIEASGISGSVVANTYHGAIVVEFDEITPEAPIAFTSYHGKIDVSLPTNARFDLKAQSSQGEILTGFDVDLIRDENIVRKTEKDGTYKVSLTDWIRGEINGGGPELLAKTHHANVYIRKKRRF